MIIPLAAYSLNWLGRAPRGYQLSAAADFVLAIVVFDAGALAAREVFEDQVAAALRGNFGLLFFTYMLATGLAWGWMFLPWEASMDTLYGQVATVGNQIRNLSKRSWAAVAAITTVHILTFLW